MSRARFALLACLLCGAAALSSVGAAQAGTFGQLTAFGSKGTGQGQFVAPGSVVTDPKNGDVLVTDLRTDLSGVSFKIVRFTAAGVFTDELANQFDASGFFAQDFGDIAIGDAGVKHYLYSVRPGSGAAPDRVQRYDLDNPATAPVLFSTSTFSGAGRLDAPGAIAIDQANGNVYIAGHTTAGDPVLQKFTSAGVKIGGQVSLSGVTTSSDDDIEAMSVTATGDLLVLDHDPDDSSAGRILRFSPSLVVDTSATILSTDAHPFFPLDIAAAPDGTIAVAHAIPTTYGDPPVISNGFGVLEFSGATGAELRRFGGPGTGTCQFSDSPHIAFAPTGGALFAVDRGLVSNSTRRVIKLGARGSGCGFDGSAPTAAFSYSPFSPKTGQTVTFDATASADTDGTIAKYEWDLDGNGTYETDTGTTPAATNVYAAAGTVNVGLRVTDDTGLTGTSTAGVVVVQGHPPTAHITASPNPAATGTTVAYDASTSVDTDGTITKYEWDLDGNGSFETDTGATATTTKSYATAQTPTVHLRVTDDDGLTGTAQIAVTISNRPPTASFTATPTSAATGTSIAFDAGASADPDGVIAKYEWDLDGNGTYETDTGTTATTTKTYATPAARDIHLRVTDANGATATTMRTVTATNRAPVPSFTASPNPVGANSTASFDASASADPDGTITKYEWDLDGNGTFETDTGTTATTSTTYATAGTRTVKLRITDDLGATATKNVDVVVTSTQPPVASFTVTPSTAATGTSIAFDAGASNDPDGLPITKYEWDLDGNGTYETDTGTTATTAKTYAKSGVRTVHLRVTDGSSDSATTMRTVTITNRGPSASFTATPATAPTGTSVAFNAGGSVDPDGTIAKYEWDLDGNGSFETDTGTTATTAKIYTTPAARTITLRVTDDEGATATTTVAVTSNNQAPTAAFTATPSTAGLGQTVAFNAGTSADPDGTIAKYEWDLDGNGSFETDTATTATTSTSYAGPGAKHVQLRVTDDHGAMTTIAHDVTVLNAPLPVAAASADLPSALTGTPITFDASSSTAPSSSIAKYEWDLDGNGTYETDTGTTASATKTYATPGPVTVHLRVTNAVGLADTTSVAVTATNRAPVAAFSATPPNAPAGAAVTFSAAGSADPDGAIVKYEWDLDGNGSFETDTGATPSATTTYATVTTRTVHLRVTDNLSASGTVGVPVTTVAGNHSPTAAFTVSPGSANVGEVVTLDGRGSTDIDVGGRIVDYAWDLDNDGVFETRSFATPQITASFSSPGLHNVRLRVTDEGTPGLTDVATRTVDVHLAEVQIPPVTTPDPPVTVTVPVPPPTLTPILTLPGASIVLKATTKIPVTLACPVGGTACTTTVTLLTATAGKRATAAKAPTTLGKVTAQAAAGKTVTAKFALSHTGAALLRKTRSISATFSSVTAGGTLTNVVAKRAVRLRASPSWKKK